MKKVMLMTVMAMALLGMNSIGTHQAQADPVGSAAKKAGEELLKGVGNTNSKVIGNATTIGKGGEVSGKNVDVGKVEADGGLITGVGNITTVNGKVNATENANVGVVDVDGGKPGLGLMYNETTVGKSGEVTGKDVNVGKVTVKNSGVSAVANVTTVDGKVEATNNADVGVVETRGGAAAVMNATTVNGKVSARNNARVGVVDAKNK